MSSNRLNLSKMQLVLLAICLIGPIDSDQVRWKIAQQTYIALVHDSPRKSD